MNQPLNHRHSATPPTRASLLPPDVSDEDLPFGPPPSKLMERESDARDLDEVTQTELDALIRNASRVLDNSSADAALCWQEAGRLLEKCALRTADAWRCYNMALNADSNYKRSLSALRRLTIGCGELELTGKIVEEGLQHATDSVEASALWTSKAVIDLKQGRRKEAKSGFERAEAADESSLAPSLLKAHLCTETEDGSDLQEVLAKIVADQFDSSLARELRLLTALVEEKIGRLDTALSRLDREIEGDPEFGVAGHWARLRLCMRLRRDEATIAAAQSLIEKRSEEMDRVAVRRIQSAVRATMLAHEEGALGLLSECRNEALNCAIQLDRVMAEFKSGTEAEGFLDRFDIQLPAVAAVASYFNLSHPGVTAGSEEDAGARIDALLWAEDWRGLADVLSGLRQNCSDERDRWALAIGEAYIGIQHMKQPDKVLAMLRGESDRINRVPLPALVRAYDADEINLAELAVAEAEDGSYDEFKAWRFAWAAHHLEPSDPVEAGRLYQRALQLMPSMMFGLAGLNRTESDRNALIKAYLSAAAAATQSEEKLDCLLRAAVLNLAIQNPTEAAALFGDAFDLVPNDPELRSVIARYARSFPEIARTEFVEPVEGGEMDILPIHCTALGYLALDIDPEQAVYWLERALSESPEDLIAAHGLHLARIRVGALDPLKKELGQAREEAKTQLRKTLHARQKIDIQHRLRDDQARAKETLEELAAMDLGNLTPNAWLFCDGLYEWQPELIVPHLAAICQKTADWQIAVAAAQAAWRVGGDDPAVLRALVSKDPTANLAAARLEGICEDREERKSLLRQLVDAGQLPIHRSRLAHVESKLGNKKEAVELLRGVLAEEPNSILDWVKLSDLLRETEDFAGLVNALETLADEMDVKEHKIHYLDEAVDNALGELLDPIRTARMCIEIMKIDPTQADAFAIGKEVLFEGGDLGPNERPQQVAFQIELLRQRIRGTEDKKRQRELHVQVAQLHLARDDREDRAHAKAHFEDALAVSKNDMALHTTLAELHREDEEWEEAIDHFRSAAKKARNDARGIDIFLRLGEIYMDHMDQLDLAEKALLKVIKWNKSIQVAVERISRLYTRSGKYDRAAKALSHLVGLSEDDDLRIGRMIELAKIQHEHLKLPTDAKQLLAEAGKVDPLAVEPVEALAKLLKEERDSVALKVHLDSKIAYFAEALAEDPDNPRIYSVLAKVLSLKGDKALEGFATELMEFVSASHRKSFAGTKSSKFDSNAQFAEPEFNPFFCPNSVPVALRGVMKVSQESIGLGMNLQPEAFGANKTTRLDRKNRVNLMIQEMSKDFGMPAPRAYVLNDGPVRVFSGSPASILLPKELLAVKDVAAIRFAVGYGLQMIRLGLTLATTMDEEPLLNALVGILRRVDPTAVPETISDEEGKAEEDKILAAMPETVLDRIRPLKDSFAEAITGEFSLDQIKSVGHRFGFMCAGSIAGAVEGIKWVTGMHRQKLGEIEGAGRLLGFLFSRTHSELRKRLDL